MKKNMGEIFFFFFFFDWEGGSLFFLFLEFDLGQLYWLLQLEVLQDVVIGIGSARFQEEEELAATMDQLYQPVLAGVILLVALQVVCDVFDLVRQDSHCIGWR